MRPSNVGTPGSRPRPQPQPPRLSETPPDEEVARLAAKFSAVAILQALANVCDKSNYYKKNKSEIKKALAEARRLISQFDLANAININDASRS